MSDQPATTSLFRALAPVLERFGNRWYVFDAQAVMLWGRPRLTGDVDVTFLLEPDDPTGLLDAMREVGFDLRVHDVGGFVRKTRVLPFLHVSTNLPLDIVLAGPGLEEEFFRGAVRVEVHGATIPFISAPDLVVTKILAGRPKDIDDVRGIIQAQGAQLDVARIRVRLRQIEAALDQSDLTLLFEAQLRAARPGS